MKHGRALILISFAGLSLSLILFFYQSEKNNFLSVSFLDVGQGDASLIKFSGGENILIDGGPDNLILNRLGEELLPYRRKINFVIISHFHDDHVAGVISVLERYRVEKIIFAAGLEKFSLGEYLLLSAQQKGITLLDIKQEASLEFNNHCRLLLINPLSLGANQNNNNSLITKLTCTSYSFLFSGDNEIEVEDLLLSSAYDLSAGVFKASHHGSKTSNQDPFLSAVSPKVIVIPVGQDNRFGHPHQNIIETAAVHGWQIKRTDEAGTVKFRVNLANIK